MTAPLAARANGRRTAGERQANGGEPRDEGRTCIDIPTSSGVWGGTGFPPARRRVRLRVFRRARVSRAKRPVRKEKEG